jgi:hypothetical protein
VVSSRACEFQLLLTAEAQKRLVNKGTVIVRINAQYRLYFLTCGKGLEETRISALEAAYYIAEHCGIPEDQIESLYDGKTSISLIVPPIVFGGCLTPLMPATNFKLARQMVKDGIKNIDIDVYQRDSFIPLPNSINSATYRFVISLVMKELLYMDANRIVELSKQPRPQDSMIIPQRIPEAVEWFAEVHTEFEKEQHRQNELRKLVLTNGWQIPPCIRRLTWADLDRNTALEACRLISGTYSFLGSQKEEIQYHILRLAKRNAIEGLREYQKLRAIMTFGVENPTLAECQHPLMSRFCPAGGCFMTELIEEYEKPYLFEQV